MVGDRYGQPGPTITVDVDGNRVWWVDSQLHRTDGPAVERTDGSREWWINDQNMDFQLWADTLAIDQDERTRLALIWG
jgi:hypothetical protein